MPTRRDIEVASPLCRAEWPDAVVCEETPNYGLAGGTLKRASIVERSCFKLMRYAARENEWRCVCGASEPGRSVAALWAAARGLWRENRFDDLVPQARHTIHRP